MLRSTKKKLELQEKLRVEAEEAAKAAEAPSAEPEEEPKAEEPFAPDGQFLADGSVRYKVLCDGGIDPSGVYWKKVVPPGASTEEYLAAQAERDAALKELAGVA